MGLNLIPAQPAGSGLDSMFNYGLPYNMGMPAGPAPAANGAPSVPSLPGVMPSTPGMNTGGSLFPVENMNAFVQDYQAPQTSQVATGNLAQGMTWGTMPMANKLQTVFGGISTLGKLYSAFQSHKLARDSLDFQKKSYKENLNNQRTSFNMALEDRANARASYSVSDTAQQDAEAYIEKHRLGG